MMENGEKMISNDKNQFIFKFKRSNLIGSIIADIFLIVISIFMLIWANSNTQFYSHIFQLIFVNIIFIALLVMTLCLFKNKLVTEILVFADGIIQKSIYKKTTMIKWRDVKKVKFSYGDSYIYIFSNDTKICINIRIDNIEYLAKYIRVHLDYSLTQKAFYNLEASTFVCLK